MTLPGIDHSFVEAFNAFQSSSNLLAEVTEEVYSTFHLSLFHFHLAICVENRILQLEFVLHPSALCGVSAWTLFTHHTLCEAFGKQDIEEKVHASYFISYCVIFYEI